ncbi:MAG: MBL fold metallo-hydrolase [Spirochaetia bacterium]|nr:MBL fold metallo-hydrolase [Spirochaetota bacterium]MCX8097269.1 MBL fold metallo-hydrolase [Spirochaetota bacterium]MDW8111877.1 MBL fold metallo-hydrolase [Spirochaetia bacterium]
MRVVFLGTGTSTGVPVIGCKCRVCNSNNPKNKRLRTSAFVEYNNKKILIDVTPDFRFQALSNNINYIDAVLITHSHADHVNGFDDLRQINFSMNWKVIPVFINRTSYWELQSRFEYVFSDSNQLGGGKPLVSVHVVEDFDEINLNGTKISTFFYYHGRLKVNGYRMGNFSYLTDVSFIPKKTLEMLEGVEVLVISALRFLPHATHLCFSEVVNLVRDIKFKKVYLTHIGHDADYDEIVEYLKGTNIEPAYDGLVLEL